MPETRSFAQLRSDGAVEVFRHHAGCTHTAAQPPVTMIVRVNLNDLRTGTGTADIDGIDTPVTASTARRLAADANVIPLVLGGNSEVLDLGRKQRLFSPAQKLAFAERDGGCAWTGCPHPPAYTQAHHIRWWDRDVGRTDLDQRHPALLASSPPGAPGRLGHPDSRQRALVQPTGTPRPHPHTPPRRTHPTPRQRTTMTRVGHPVNALSTKG